MFENVLLLMLDGVALGCIYALIALGYTMVYGIIKLINFAHGEFFMIGGYAALGVLAVMPAAGDVGAAGAAVEVLVAMSVGGAAAAVLAVAVEKLAYKPLRQATRIAALLTALGVSLFLQNAAQKAFSPNTKAFPIPVADRRYPRIGVNSQEILAGKRPGVDIYSTGETGEEVFLGVTEGSVTDRDIVLKVPQAGTKTAQLYYYPQVTVRRKQLIIWASAVLMTLGLHVLVKYTKMGKAMRAVSYDFEAAELMGINVNRVISFTFFVGAILAGAAAVLVGMYYGSIKPTMGVMYGLKAFVAAVLGGIGSIPGALAGSLVLGIAESLVKLSSHTAPYQDAFAFAVLVLILVFLPNGFFGREERERV